MVDGTFTGAIVVTLLDDGRYVQLMQPVSYIDGAGLAWAVPKDAKLDGASIPRPLWSLIGGPFEGKYRNASVFHDWYCDTRERPWQSVHRMFYEAMLTSGVNTTLAKIMYAGVYWGGPRWAPATSDNMRVFRDAVAGPAPQTIQEVVKHLNTAQRAAADQIDIAASKALRSAFPDRLEVGPLNGTIKFYPDDAKRIVPVETGGPPAESDLAALSFSRAFTEKDVEALKNEISAAPDLSLNDIDGLVDRRALDKITANWSVEVRAGKMLVPDP